MPRLRVIEILGGPLDGRRVPWDPDNECLAYTDGMYVYQHFIDEVYTGKGVTRCCGMSPRCRCHGGRGHD